MRKIYETRTAGIRRWAVCRDAGWNEYRVRQYTNGILTPEADYFTPDKQDALNTAKALYEGELHLIEADPLYGIYDLLPVY